MWTVLVANLPPRRGQVVSALSRRWTGFLGGGRMVKFVGWCVRA